MLTRYPVRDGQSSLPASAAEIRPIPTELQDGPKILGYACKIMEVNHSENQ